MISRASGIQQSSISQAPYLVNFYLLLFRTARIRRRMQLKRHQKWMFGISLSRILITLALDSSQFRFGHRANLTGGSDRSSFRWHPDRDETSWATSTQIRLKIQRVQDHLTWTDKRENIVLWVKNILDRFREKLLHAVFCLKCLNCENWVIGGFIIIIVIMGK